jgi:hypothetical protein
LSLVGECAPEEVTNSFLDAMNDPDYPEVAELLVDVTASSLAERMTHEIRYVARFLGPHAERIGGRCAVLVSSDLDFGLTKMGAIFAAAVGVDTQIFRSEESARYWLGANRPEAD